MIDLISKLWPLLCGLVLAGIAYMRLAGDKRYPLKKNVYEKENEQDLAINLLRSDMEKQFKEHSENRHKMNIELTQIRDDIKNMADLQEAHNKTMMEMQRIQSENLNNRLEHISNNIKGLETQQGLSKTLNALISHLEKSGS